MIPDDYATYSADPNDNAAMAAELEALFRETQQVAPLSEIENKAIQEHQITGDPLCIIAQKYNLDLRNKDWWGTPKDFNDDIHQEIVDLIGTYRNPLVDMAKAVAMNVQFPINTTFLHVLGAVSSATIRRFAYKSRYGAMKHCGLYTLGAQPPSTGKSPTNKYIVDPIKKYIDQDNERNEPVRMLLADEVERLEKEFKKSKIQNEKKNLAERIIAKKRELLLNQEYVWGTTDTTAEALEESAASQNGRFAIVSDEAEAVSVVLGLNYNPNGLANMGFVLKGFDGGEQLTLRVGRKGYRGTVVGSVAVMAQESTVTNILRAGREGGGSRGICERFLILSEPNIIHKKNYRQVSNIPDFIQSNYNQMIAAIINTQNDVSLVFSDEAIEFVIQILEGLHVHIVDGGKYANELMRGIIGKAETQIYKIAATLHIAKEWAPPSFTKREVIQVAEVAAAAQIYVQLVRSFVDVAADEGVAGKTLELRVIAKRLKSIVNDGKKPRQIIKLADFTDSIKNTLPFSNIRGLRKYIKNLIPDMQQASLVVLDEKEGNLFINPHFKD